ncbi:MAG: glycosyltransferase [Paludibacteraceae bacterium]|nr:glycosyltransferase [Paludibacteraceae bacterium]
MKQFTVPILLITFNRPNHVRRVLGSLRNQEPVELYVFQDGARDGNSMDKERCAVCRRVIEEDVDWDCQVHTYYSKENLGCGKGPLTAIQWFFRNVERGIVMEDDCLPHPDFYGYCEELLQRYKDDPSVVYVASTLYSDRWQCEASYGFSHYMVSGAWAAWSRLMDGYDFDLKDVNAEQFKAICRKQVKEKAESDWWYFKLMEIQQDNRKKDYWDYQMQIHLFRTGGLVIHPKKNLVSNIGFDAEGTHTSENDGRGNLQSYPILPLKHPSQKTVNLNMDYLAFAKIHSRGVLCDAVSYLYRRMLYDDGMWHRLLMLYKRMKHGK